MTEDECRKKSFKQNYTFPRECSCGIIGHTTKLSERAPLLEASGQATLCVLAHAHTAWHDVDVTTKLCFAQLRIDIISDHVIAPSAGQRERSRSGSVTSHFLKHFLVFHFFERFIVVLFIRRFVAVAENIHDDNEIWTTSSSMLASRRRELEEALFANFELKRREVRHHSR